MGYKPNEQTDMKKKTLQIKNLRVDSFVTTVSNQQQQLVKGGYITYSCTAGWNGCGGGTNDCDPGGSGSCNPNPMYTHRPCDTFPAHCSPCK